MRCGSQQQHARHFSALDVLQCREILQIGDQTVFCNLSALCHKPQTKLCSTFSVVYPA